jgi:hypothetical protein
VKPVRFSYVHVGPSGPSHPLRDLTPAELERYARYNYVKFEVYPGADRLGRYWTQESLDRIGKGCGATTTMGRSIAETYAGDPGFYGATFCATCRAHFPVGESGEFVWAGTDERVGS